LVAPSLNSLNKSKVPKEQINKIAEIIAVNYEIPPTYAILAIILLFWNGAANRSTPDSITIEIFGPDRKIRTISKRDLMYAYELITKNK
jgi:hypothetical protein